MRFLPLALLLIAAAPCLAADHGGEDFHPIQSIAYENQLFVGTLVSAAVVPYVPSGPCAGGVTPREVAEVIVRPTRIFHASGLAPEEPIALRSTFPAPSAMANLVPGSRVLVYGNRACSDNWRIWGELALVDSLGQISPRGQMAMHFEEWVSRTGHRPTIDELSAPGSALADSSPGAPFQHFRALDLVRVRSKRLVGFGVLEFTCDPIARVLGTRLDGPRRLRFHAPRGGYGLAIEVGDSLLVPRAGGAPADTADFPTSADWSRVEGGFSPCLNVTIDHVRERFRATADGYELVPFTTRTH